MKKPFGETGLAMSQHHAGIAVSEQMPVGEVLKRVQNLAAALKAEDMAVRLEYLSGWEST
jgi:hypothetical protein